MAEKLQSAQFGPQIIGSQEFQKAKEREANKEAAAQQQKLFWILGGTSAVVLLGLGTFLFIRRKKSKGGK